MKKTWWEHSQLVYEGEGEVEGLKLGRRWVRELSRCAATPFYAYSAARIEEKIQILRQTLRGITPSHTLYYAMKANRNPHVLGTAYRAGAFVDTCSGSEILLALSVGWTPEQISFTSAAITEADLGILARMPEIKVNCDSVHQLRLMGEHCPGRPLGIRCNPSSGFGYSTALEYSSGNKVTKFGIYLNDLPGALECIKEKKIALERIHCHAGWGLQNRQLDGVGSLLAQLKKFIDVVGSFGHEIKGINLGGGLGTPMGPGDTPLDLAAWSNIVLQGLGREWARGVHLCLEPGDFLVRDSGILVTKILSVEEKNGVNFVLVDANFAVNLQQASYGLPMEALPVNLPKLETSQSQENTHSRKVYRVVGSINEAVDVFVNETTFGHWRPQPGELLAFPGLGAYGSSMASQHCLRGQFGELLVAIPPGSFSDQTQ